MMLYALSSLRSFHKLSSIFLEVVYKINNLHLKNCSKQLKIENVIVLIYGILTYCSIVFFMSSVFGILNILFVKYFVINKTY